MNIAIFILITTFLSQAQSIPIPAQKPVFSNEGLIESYQANQTTTALEEDCNPSTTAESLTQIGETLEKAGEASYQLDFICEVKILIDKENNKMQESRAFMLSYIDKKPEDRSPEDHQRMTELMIKHRMLKDESGVSSKPNRLGIDYFVPATRYIPPEVTQRQIRELAKKHIESDGPPDKCLFYVGKQIHTKDIKSEDCRNEIMSKVQPIPAPLILSQCALESGWGENQEHDNIIGLQVQFKDPSTMTPSVYPNCRRAKKDPHRCMLKFNGYEGSIDEYFSRFNAAHLAGYQRYRVNRLKLYENNQGNSDACEMAKKLLPSVKGYAEDEKYLPHIKGMLDNKICNMMEKCENQSAKQKTNIKNYQPDKKPRLSAKALK